MRPPVMLYFLQVGEFVEGVQEELGVLNELRYEWRRLQTFVNWPHSLPRPAELAKAGFYFCPADDAPDRHNSFKPTVRVGADIC